MKKCRKTFLCLLLCVLLLAGCAQGAEPTITESLVWDQMPQLTYGQWEYEKLEVLPWYSGRAEAVSRSAMAETELGYYVSVTGILHYADKINLQNWVPVCNQARCIHYASSWSYGQPVCNAKVSSGKFLIRNGRILYEEMSSSYPQIYPDKEAFGTILVSKALDGTDPELVYVQPEMMGMQGSVECDLLTAHYWLRYASKMQSDGTYRNTTYLLTEKGVQVLREDITEDMNDALLSEGRFGDPHFLAMHLDPDGTKIFRVQDGALVETELAAGGLPDRMGYLSGNIYRYFVPGEGYYDADLKTGERVFLASPRLENSMAYPLLPNCIIETTLYYDRQQQRPEGMIYAMEVFDGQQWHKVTLPEEVVNATSRKYITVPTVTSDKIIFQLCDSAVPFMNEIYCIDITQTEWKAELCAQISILF